ncbi:MAG: permease-like cell division protein FtsX [Thermodesulfobacteriota bacterium]|nr:permease-like cell division protein FtsX [Thermodesulfobacteriota bacterium]
MNLTVLSSVLRRVRRNIAAGPYLHLAATATIAFSMLILGVFSILYVNISDLLRSWQQDIRVVAYLEEDLVKERLEALRQHLAELPGVEKIRYVSQEEAMSRLRSQMKHRASLLDGLKENPLPASLEIHLAPGWQQWERLDPLADEIKTFSGIEDVAAAEAWLHRFTGFMGFFRLASLIVGGLVFATTVFVCANTIRLTLYAKRQEIEIMKLVGATDSFVKTPFYAQNLLEGALGGIVGLGFLFISFRLFIARLHSGHALLSTFDIRFLSLTGCAALLFVGILMSWIGSYLSLRQFLKP